MSPLSKDLSGIILPHDSYGSHLGANGSTIDKGLEIRKFEKAENCLAEVWNESVLDGYPVHATYVTPGQRQFGSVPQKSEGWKSIHVRQSQYLLQVVKCEDFDCCGPMRSNLKSYLPSGFLPPPLKFIRNSAGIVPAPRGSAEDGKFIGLSKRMCLNKLDPEYIFKETYHFPLPYDFHCPSLSDKQLEERICKECGIYFSSKKSQTAHAKMHRAFASEGVTYFYYDVDSVTEPISDDESDNESLYDEDSDTMHIIQDLSSWYDGNFEEV